jgi:hypothetical protein
MKKRPLAAPFVLTALLSPAFADISHPTRNPPPQPRKLPQAPDKSRVRHDEDGTCWYRAPAHCPPNAKCNPPAPYQVECPKK